METYVIAKKITINDMSSSVLILDGADEILEFDNLEKAEEIRKMLQETSSFNCVYTIKTVK